MNRIQSAAAPSRRSTKKRSRAEIEPLLPKIRQILQDLYGDRLVKIILYGSFARNRATEDSDIDIAVVLKGKVAMIAEIDRIHEVLYPLSLETDELISVYPVEEDQFRTSRWPLFYYMRKEGIAL